MHTGMNQLNHMSVLIKRCKSLNEVCTEDTLHSRKTISSVSNGNVEHSTSSYNWWDSFIVKHSSPFLKS